MRGWAKLTEGVRKGARHPVDTLSGHGYCTAIGCLGRTTSIYPALARYFRRQKPVVSDSLFFNPRKSGGHATVSGNIVHASDDNFEGEVMNADRPVLVDYWAEWCGPCKMIAPILDEVADSYGDRLKVVKLNIDENPETPPKYGIRGIPTLMLFKNGNVEATKVGALSKSQLTAFIDSNL